VGGARVESSDAVTHEGATILGLDGAVRRDNDEHRDALNTVLLAEVLLGGPFAELQGSPWHVVVVFLERGFVLIGRGEDDFDLFAFLLGVVVPLNELWGEATARWAPVSRVIDQNCLAQELVVVEIHAFRVHEFSCHGIGEWGGGGKAKHGCGEFHHVEKGWRSLASLGNGGWR